MVNYLVSQARQRVREWLARQMKRLEKQERERKEGWGDAVKEREKRRIPLTLHSLIPTPPFFSSLFRIVLFLDPFFSLIRWFCTLFSLNSFSRIFHASFNESLKTFEWLHKHANDHLNIRWKERKN